jgi:hypothetical protein
VAPVWSPPPPRPGSPGVDRLVETDELDEAVFSERPAAQKERTPTESKKKPKRRRVRRRFSFLAWMAAFGLFVGIVGVAGLLLQYKGLPWMPPELAARVPPWLARLFH